MPVHDLARVAGVTEACKYNDHTDCHNPACSCTCHPWNQPKVEAVEAQVEQAKPEKVCPKCQTKRPWGETFCRIDGERLASLLCPICGAGKNPEDLFCWSCGAGKDTPAQVSVAPVPIATEDTTEIDYAHTVLRNIQAELGQSMEDSNAQQSQEGVAQVIEQPAGTGGSFKLVSKPNPNKIRSGAPVGPQGGNPSSPQNGSGQPPPSQPRRVRLPIKPS